MSAIRRQSIISSIVIYIGFAIGMLNVYFFTKQGLFTEEQYGLTGVFIAIALAMQAFAAFGMPSYVYKFYPYYNYHLPDKKNDMLSWALLISIIGFIVVMVGGWMLKDIVVKKYSVNAPKLVNYYYWIFPMALGLTVYTTLEAYTQIIKKPVLTNFLREVEWRLVTTILIVLFILGVIKNFAQFIKLFAFGYPVIALTLLIYLIYTKNFRINFSPSKVTRRYFKKIVSFSVFTYSGMLIFTVSQVFDSMVIASVLKNGLEKVAIFTLAQTMTSVIQAPQRGIIAASIAHLSQAWKDKNIALLQKIYQRSSLNLLLFAAGIYLLIALNYTEAIQTLHLKPSYLLGFSAFIVLGLTKVIDLGTGLNAQIIGTSNYWRFELFCGIILLVLTLPLTYFFAKKYDILGPPIATLISIAVYNSIRIVFLWKKFKLQPFTKETIYTLFVALICFGLCYFLFKNIHGFSGLILRSIAFMFLYGGSIILFNLSPDVKPVWNTIKKRMKIDTK
jgi:O-antigen/teichoic acid export membrane protein